MSENNPENEQLSEELRNLGKNLLGVLQAAWDHPERKRMQLEIEGGLREISDSFQQEFDNFSKSETGEKIKADIDDIGKRVRNGETQARIYEDLLSALKTANSELSNVISKLGKSESESVSPTESGTDSS